MLQSLLKRKYFVVLICVVVIITLLSVIDGVYLKKLEKQNFITDAVGIVVSPVQGAFSWMTKSVASVPKFFVSKKKLREENEYLKQQVVNQKRDIEILESYKTENERLRSILDLKQWNREYEMIGAQIIAGNTSGLYDTLKINKGSISGIAKGDVVVSNTGLVGYVSDVGTTWSNISTIVSPSSSVSCIIPRTGEIVMVDGSELKNGKITCTLSYLSTDSIVSEGETVETSGDGEIYPKGMLVGRVTSLYDGEDGITKKAVVTPVADFKKLSEVLVVKTNKE